MKIFLVRHAMVRSQRTRWQTPKSKIGKIGREQSELLANRSRFKTVDLIISSNWRRARETAELISIEVKKPLEVYDGIHEREQHPEIYGVDRNAEISRKFYRESMKNYSNLDWKFEDKGESYREVIERARNFKRHLLKKHRNKTLLVVSHDIFIRCFITLCLLGNKYEDDTFKKIFNSLTISNAGISLIEFIEKVELWRFWYLNDFSHLKVLTKIDK